ncbi:MarR family winged helix-turn-helix transcriptional regulator [Actinacidiphila yeochonensis]|uniref:MarR family winged helix-turn-helix transcriptional regulator n=1 Tax=Actinacidiphila yeochonensis TaxID=89050 RepID=UPI00055C2B4A|nr:MarR family transcriptional regulator [Actinacidiphila yeochonensis]
MDAPEPRPGAASPTRLAADLRATLGPLTRRLRRCGPDDELTLSQVSVLVLLDREGPATSSELAAREGVRPQSMCAIVGVLSGRGLVEREQDPADGRRMVVSLTQDGREGLLGARRERARRLAEAVEAELDADERERLAAALPLLERITRHV